MSQSKIRPPLFREGQIARIVSAEELEYQIEPNHLEYGLAVAMDRTGGSAYRMLTDDPRRKLEAGEFALIATTEIVRFNYFSGATERERRDPGIEIEPIYESAGNSDEVRCRIGIEFRIAAHNNENVARSLHGIMTRRESEVVSAQDFLNERGREFGDYVHLVVQSFLLKNTANDLVSSDGFRELNQDAKDILAPRLNEVGLKYVRLVPHIYPRLEKKERIKESQNAPNTNTPTEPQFDREASRVSKSDASGEEHPQNETLEYTTATESRPGKEQHNNGYAVKKDVVSYTADGGREIPATGEVKFVYLLDTQSEWGMYVIDPDGSRRDLFNERTLRDQRLIPAGSPWSWEGKPLRVFWSPGGTSVVFTAFPTGQRGLPVHLYIYTTGGYGKDLKMLLKKAESVRPLPTWSLGGNRIAFVTGNQPSIYVMNQSGSNMQKLPGAEQFFHQSIPQKIRGAFTRQSKWVPEDIRVLFSVQKNIFAYMGSNSSFRRVTSGHLRKRAVEWSPDGSRITYLSCASDLQYEHDTSDDIDICTVNYDGADQQTLVNLPGRQIRPSWSPDGNRIAFSSNHEGRYNIYTIDVNSSQIRQVTNGTKDEGVIGWSPDGSRIAFKAFGINAQDRTRGWSPDGIHTTFGSDLIYTIDADGSYLHKVSGSDFDTKKYGDEDLDEMAIEINRLGIDACLLPDSGDVSIFWVG